MTRQTHSIMTARVGRPCLSSSLSFFPPTQDELVGRSRVQDSLEEPPHGSAALRPSVGPWIGGARLRAAVLLEEGRLERGQRLFEKCDRLGDDREAQRGRVLFTFVLDRFVRRDAAHVGAVHEHFQRGQVRNRRRQRASRLSVLVSDSRRPACGTRSL